MQKKITETKLIYCNQCRSETNHSLRGSYERRREYVSGIIVTNSSGKWDEFDTAISKMWVCLGCEKASLETIYTDSSMVDRDGTQEYEVQIYPARMEFYVTGKQFRQLPQQLSSIYREILLTFNNQLNILCAVGIRTLIEGICADHEITGRNLENKIDGLTSILPKNIVMNLHNLRFMGNEAAHELSAPSQQELRLAIEICEDLLNYLYELDYKVSSLDKVRKNRKSSENDIDSSKTRES
jgi:hypothetical protein